MISSEHKEKVQNFLKNNPFVVIGTSENNVPYTATVFFVMNNDLDGFFVTKSDTQKYRHLKGNPNISIATSDLDEQITLQIQGVAKEIQFSKELELGLLHLFENNEIARKWSIPVFKFQDGDFSIFQVHANKIRFGMFKSNKEQDAEYFEEIL